MDITQVATAARSVRRLKSEPNLFSYMFMIGENLVTIAVEIKTYLMFPIAPGDDARVNTIFSADLKVGESFMNHTEGQEKVLKIFRILEDAADQHDRDMRRQVERAVGEAG